MMAKTKSQDVPDTASGRTPEDLIAQAMAQAAIDSGANALPPAGEVPIALAAGRVMASEVPEITDSVIAAARHASVLDLGDHCPPDVADMAKALSSTLATKAPPPPPVQVGRGDNARMMPATVRTFPAALHESNSTMAKQLWNAFLGPHKRTVAILAQQAGFVRQPFVWLSQALWALIELDNWKPKKVETDQPFDVAEEASDSAMQRGLVTAFGPDNARLITRLAEQVGISVISLLYHAFAQLAANKQAHLRKAQISETVEQWAE
jgi:hypothetical protein